MPSSRATSHSVSENEDEEHTPYEHVWLARYEHLKDRGYLLRQRYRPGWVPTWKARPGLRDVLCEDWITISNARLLDAQRISDGLFVMLKEVPSSSSEALIACYLSSDSLRNDPRNHAVPVLDVFPDPLDDKKTLLVFPLLGHVEKPPFISIPEVIGFIEQTLEGIVFLHEHEVAHRDCALGNIMLDARPLYPVPWHPQSPGLDQQNRRIMNIKSRTDVPGVRYFFTDFGLSTRGQDRTVGFDGIERAPELSYHIPYDPYRLDVYILGRLYQTAFVEKYVNLTFLQPLIDRMTAQDPQNRPSAAEAYAIFAGLRAKVDIGWFSQRLRMKEEGAITRAVEESRYWLDRQWARFDTQQTLIPFEP